MGRVVPEAVGRQKEGTKLRRNVDTNRVKGEAAYQENLVAESVEEIGWFVQCLVVQ